MITTIRKTGIIMLCLFLSAQIWALGANRTTLKERTDSWLKSSAMESGYGGDTGGTGESGLTGGGDSGADSTVPVGDALPLILLFSGAYCVYKKRCTVHGTRCTT
jgi:hypothetical protein